MLLVLVAGLLGGVGLVSVAGGVTLAATSHPIPTELWTTASVAIGGLAALLAGHGVSTSTGTPAPVAPPDPVPAASTTHVVNISEGATDFGPVTREISLAPPLGATPPEGLRPHDVSGGHPDLPPPPKDRSRGRASPPGRSPRPPRPRTTTRAKSTARRR